MLIKQIFLGIIGISGGAAAAAGVFALITTIGVVPRMAGKTHTGNHVRMYETAIVLGGVLGSVYYTVAPQLNMSTISGNSVLGISGIFVGIFVGAMATALAETLNVTAIFSRRLKLVKGMGLIIISLALGKALGSLFQFWMSWAKTN